MGKHKQRRATEAAITTTGLAKTIAWYLGNQPWVDAVRTGEYRKWLATNYDGRAHS